MSQRKTYELGDELPIHGQQDAVIQYLWTRRSSLAVNLVSPGPNQEQLQDLLTIAARVPDHRRLTPFRFIVIEGEGRSTLGDKCLQIALSQNPELPEAIQRLEQQRFMRAPTVVAVAYSPKNDGKTPEWEQTLSCGACCYNLLLAANASGFGAQWITEWLTYSPELADSLGLLDHERIAGFIYIGTNSERLKERARPAISDLITRI